MEEQSKQSKGGEERAKSLPEARRKDIAKQAADARWGLPTATHEGTIKLAEGAIQIPCAVLNTTTRVLTQEGFLGAIGRARKAKAGTGSTEIVGMVDGLPPFLAAANLNPFISDALRQSTTPVIYRTTRGQRAFGYDATLLPGVCEVYLKARDAGALLKTQKHIARACEILIRGLANVGIIALVDEATGHQYDRPREALAEILQKFISKSLCEWAKTFENDFYEELFRLRKWHYSSFSTKRPILAGKLTIDIVYQRLAPAVLDELRRLNPPNEQGRRKHKLFQHLTPNVGHPKLKEHLAAVTALMRASDTWEDFKRILDRAFLKYPPMPLFDLARKDAETSTEEDASIST